MKQPKQSVSNFYSIVLSPRILAQNIENFLIFIKTHQFCEIIKKSINPLNIRLNE